MNIMLDYGTHVELNTLPLLHVTYLKMQDFEIPGELVL